MGSTGRRRGAPRGGGPARRAEFLRGALWRASSFTCSNFSISFLLNFASKILCSELIYSKIFICSNFFVRLLLLFFISNFSLCSKYFCFAKFLSFKFLLVYFYLCLIIFYIKLVTYHCGNLFY